MKEKKITAMSPPPGNHEYDSSFIEKLRRQDQVAFRKLFADLAGVVFARAVIILGSHTSAEDATQEVFFKAYCSLPLLKDGKVKPWLMTITRNHCFDEIRRQKCRPGYIDKPLDNLADKVCENRSEAADVLAILPEEIRQPLMLKVVEGLKYKEIAEILEKTEGTLRNLVCKGLKILRKEIEE